MNNELAFGSKTLNSDKPLLRKKKIDLLYTKMHELLLINKLSANIKDNKDLTKDGDTSIKISQTVEVLTKKYKNPPKYSKNSTISMNIRQLLFQSITEDLVRREILILDGSTTTSIYRVPVNMLK